MERDPEVISNLRNIGFKTLKEFGFPSGATGWDTFDPLALKSKVRGCCMYFGPKELVHPHWGKTILVSTNGYFFELRK